MDASYAFEITASLCLQVTMVVLATVLFERWLEEGNSLCRLWTACFLSILGLIGGALLLPHVRMISMDGPLSRECAPLIVFWQTRVAKVLLAVWLLGLGLRVVRRAVRCYRLIDFLNRRCRPLTIAEHSLLPVSRQETPPNTRWLVSDENEGPFCWQLHRPTIVIPQYALRGGRDSLRHVLRHEIEHVRTGHPLQLFLQGICGALLWFHPAIWWASRNAELAREYACDEAAAKSSRSVAGYLRTLAMIAERHAGAPSCTLGFGRGKSGLLRRSERLVRMAEQSRSGWTHRGGVALLTLALVAVLANQIWLPINPRASSRSRLSPWPTWTAGILHDFGINVRDFERFDEHHDLRGRLRAGG